MIKLSGINFNYPSEQPLFSNLNLEIKKGERIGLVGQNGTGKSTLMQIMVGLLKPTSGQMVMFGKLREVEHDFIEVRRKLGYLFQDPDDQLFCPTVDEDIAFGPLNLGMSHKQARARVDASLAMLEIESLRGRLAHKLSGGEKRMAALASVIAMQPECLLLDEPTAGLDEKKRELLINYLDTYHETLLIASHDTELLERLTVRTISL